MEPDFRPKFIQWLTGSKRLPKGGFGNLENQVSINRIADHTLRDVSPDEKCPSVNTCHHYVKFPEYSSYEILKHKFEQAILYGADNFALTWANNDTKTEALQQQVCEKHIRTKFIKTEFIKKLTQTLTKIISF